MFPLTVTFTVNSAAELDRLSLLLSGSPTAPAPAFECVEAPYAGQTVTASVPLPSVSPAPKTAKKAPEPAPAVKAPVAAPAAEPAGAVTYDDIKALISKAVAAGKRDKAVDAMGRFNDADGKPCAKGPSVQPADYPELAEMLNTLLAG